MASVRMVLMLSWLMSGCACEVTTPSPFKVVGCMHRSLGALDVQDSGFDSGAEGARHAPPKANLSPRFPPGKRDSDGLSQTRQMRKRPAIRPLPSSRGRYLRSISLM